MGEGTVRDARVVEDDGDIDPTNLRDLFFRPLKLAGEKLTEVESDLKALVKDAHDTRSDLDNLLAHWNDLAEGVAPPKNFPWPNSSNLHIPVAETKLNELHSASRQSLLRPDQLFYVRGIGDPLEPQLTAKLEQYLNYKATVELPIVGAFSDLVWAAARDGTALAHVYYHEDVQPRPSIKTYRGLQEFVAAYPEVEGSGLTKGQYQKVLDKFAGGAKTVRLLEEEDQTIYRGPKVDVVELADFLMSPMTAIRTEYARLVGKVFTLRAPEIRARAEAEGWDDEAVDRVVASNDPGRRDMNTSIKDQIEGIARSYIERETNGEFVLYNGIYRADLNDDGIEEKYLVTYHYLSGTLLGGIHFPYIHGRDNFVPVRLKKRPNRFLGRGIVQMVDDANIEINTQHNQRIDSRTVTTVPTFKCKRTEQGNFDPSRPDARFSPGKVFYLTDINALEQFALTQTDMSESLQEESALMSLVDKQVGSSADGMLGQQGSRTPAKVRMAAMNIAAGRMDDYFEEIAGNGALNEGLNAVGEQILALLHQFMTDTEIIPLTRGGNLAAPAAPSAAPAPGAQTPQQPGAPPAPGAAPMLAAPGAAPMLPPGQAPAGAQPSSVTITPENLDAAQGRVRVGLAKTTMALNPDNAMTRWMQIYSLLVMDPLVGGNPKGRLALDRKLLDLARVENPDQYLPPDPQTAQQWMQMQQAIVMSAQHQKGGRPGARNRGGAMKPSAGGGPGPKG